MNPLERGLAFYRKHARWVPIASFLLGFVFDAVMLRRIDELKVLLQQAAYLIIVGTLVGIELITEVREVQAPLALQRLWKYREAAIHFLLGTLLNSYAIFYFKSASALTSFVFIALMVGLVTLHEFSHFGKSQARVHVALLSLCLSSYLICLTPIILGFIGKIPFLCATAASIAIFSGYYMKLKPELAGRPGFIRTHLLYPYVGVQTAFFFMYFAHLIPPVPLSVRYMGIYHGVEKTARGFELTYYRNDWRFWQHGDQTFRARPGDSLYCYSQIFSPTRFKDDLHVRWLFRDARKGWLPADAIPITVQGGRDEGYRATTRKVNFFPGTWRVQIETRENQEIGRIDFKVIADETTDARVPRVDVR